MTDIIKQAEVALTFNEWFCALPEPRQAVLRDDKWMLAQAAWDAASTHARAQEAEVVRLREAIVRDANEKLARLVEWLKEDEDNAELLIAAMSQEQLSAACAALTPEASHDR